jgi:hypothetical protein
MPAKRASSLPSTLQCLVSTNSTDTQANMSQEMPPKCASGARLVLEKCAQIKQAWGRYGSYRPYGGYYPQQGYSGYYPPMGMMPYQGYSYPRQGMSVQQPPRFGEGGGPNYLQGPHWDEFDRIAAQPGPQRRFEEEEEGLPSWDSLHQQHQSDIQRLYRYALANNLAPERVQAIKAKYEAPWQQKQKLLESMGIRPPQAQPDQAALAKPAPVLGGLGQLGQVALQRDQRRQVHVGCCCGRCGSMG